MTLNAPKAKTSRGILKQKIMKEDKRKRGGARLGSGRKPGAEKTEINLKIPVEKVEKSGGRKAFYSACYELIEKYL